MPDIHLPIGTSKVHRVIACPASYKRGEAAPAQQAGNAAKEGTLLHTVMENHYDGTEAFTQVGKIELDDLVFTNAMLLDQVEPAITATETALDSITADELILEKFVQYIPDLVGGTLDMLALSEDEKTVLCLDYKFGFNGVAVENNKQILLAVLAASVDPETAPIFKKAEKFVAAIVQPKVYGNRPALWEFTKTELNDFEDTLIVALDEAQSDTPTAHTGSHCLYCPAAPYCPEKKLSVRSALVLNKEDSAQLAEAMSLVSELEDWCKGIRTTAQNSLEAGAVVPGWKLVQKRASRVWTDAEQVEDIIRKARSIKLEEGFTVKLKSPAQLEKVCKAKKIDFKKYNNLIASVSSGTTLAPESDKRPGVNMKEIPQNMLDLVEQS